MKMKHSLSHILFDIHTYKLIIFPSMLSLTHTHTHTEESFCSSNMQPYVYLWYANMEHFKELTTPEKKKKNYNPSPRLSVKYSHGSSEETSTRVKVAQTKLDTEIQWQDHLFITNAATDATVTKAACKALILKAPRRKENIETFRTT